MRHVLVNLLAALTLALSGCGYNTLQSTDEQTKASWSEVLNQYWSPIPPLQGRVTDLTGSLTAPQGAAL